MCLHNPSKITKSGRIEVRILLKFAYIVITPIPLVPGDDYQLYVESTRRTCALLLETCPLQVLCDQDAPRKTCARGYLEQMTHRGRGRPLLALLVAHKGEEHGRVEFAPGFV